MSLCFFRKDRPKTEGSRHADHLINFSPVRSGDQAPASSTEWRNLSSSLIEAHAGNAGRPGHATRRKGLAAEIPGGGRGLIVLTIRTLLSLDVWMLYYTHTHTSHGGTNKISMRFRWVSLRALCGAPRRVLMVFWSASRRFAPRVMC